MNTRSRWIRGFRSGQLMILGILALLSATACGAGTGGDVGGGIPGCNPDIPVCPLPIVLTPPSTAAPYTFCPLPNLTPPQLVYPNPNIPIAAGSVGEIVVADVAAVPYLTVTPGGPGTNGFYVVFSTLSTQTAFANAEQGQGGFAFSDFLRFTQISAGQLPPGTATPTIGSPVYEAATKFFDPRFSAGTLYYAYLTTDVSDCLPTGPVGSFTTQ